MGFDQELEAADASLFMLRKKHQHSKAPLELKDAYLEVVEMYVSILENKEYAELVQNQKLLDISLTENTKTAIDFVIDTIESEYAATQGKIDYQTSIQILKYAVYFDDDKEKCAIGLKEIATKLIRGEFDRLSREESSAPLIPSEEAAKMLTYRDYITDYLLIAKLLIHQIAITNLTEKIFFSLIEDYNLMVFASENDKEDMNQLTSYCSILQERGIVFDPNTYYVQIIGDA
jgi:hypothetical protein